jgi:hypothetical protein
MRDPESQTINPFSTITALPAMSAFRAHRLE